MKIIAFETSCDDTSIALFDNDQLVAMDTKSQIKIHELTGGVVPEVAAREHANAIFSVLDTVLEESQWELAEIDYIAVTVKPGLIPSLLTGVTVAGALSNLLQKPILPIHHIEAHIFSIFLERKEREISFPFVCLTVSGGHNEIYHIKDMWSYERLGGTMDDAAGEAFDKVAKMIGLGYPGGPIISKLASEYDKEFKGIFPKVWLEKDEFDFSFSGLKSAVKREVDKRQCKNTGNLEGQCIGGGDLSDDDKKEISFEFEVSVTEVLAYKLVNAAIKKGIKTVVLAGGVSANTRLRYRIQELCKEKELDFMYPKKLVYCMDNAGMVGINAYYRIKYKQFEYRIGTPQL